jgi:hypothetical protein
MPSSARRLEHDDALALLERAIDEHRKEPLGGLLAARGIGRYRGYAELLSVLRSLTGRGARLSVVGHSVRGQPLFALELGNAKPSHEDRTSALVAGIHPNEWIGIETALALLGRFVDRDLGSRSLLAIPIANPDGLLRVESNLRAGRKRFVRHNARQVDLNRNFDAGWGHKNLLAKLVPWVFKPGSHAASEPEVAAIASAFGSRRVDRALSLHSFGGVVLYPSAQTVLPIPDAAEHRRWAKRIGGDADARPYFALPSSWFGMGMTMGGLELDWFHQRHGALSLLVECSRGGIALRPSCLLDPFAWFNPRRPDRVAAQLAKATEPFLAGEPEA